ncbi:MAG: sugar phosphate isomerase/epimerase [bacterium]|nr:sugar phosphate isomerase/epimerase [bacterium]
MRLSFISDELTVDDMRFARDNGFDGLETNIHIQMGSQNEAGKLLWLEKRADAARASLDDHGLKMAAMGVWELNFINARERDRCIEYYERMVNLAVTLGCPVLYHGCGDVPGLSPAAKIERYLTVGETLVHLAEKEGLRACIYSGDLVHFAWDPTTWGQIFPRVPTLGLKYDPSHLFYERCPYLEPLVHFFREFGPKVYHVHIKDVHRISDHEFLEPPAGMGEIDWPAILAVLYANKYDGFLSLEPRGRWATDPDLRYLGLRLGKQYLQCFMV